MISSRNQRKPETKTGEKRGEEGEEEEEEEADAKFVFANAARRNKLLAVAGKSSWQSLAGKLKRQEETGGKEKGKERKRKGEEDRQVNSSQLCWR